MGLKGVERAAAQDVILLVTKNCITTYPPAEVPSTFADAEGRPHGDHRADPVIG